MKLALYSKYKPSSVEWLGEVPAHWEVMRLKYFTSINDEALPETTDPGFEMSYVDISSVDQIRGIVAVEEMVFEDAPSRARRVVRDGDTIVSTVRTYLRAIAPVSNPASNTIVSTGFAVVKAPPSNTDLRSANLDKAHRGIVKLSCLAPFRPRSATSKSLCAQQTVGAGRAAW